MSGLFKFALSTVWSPYFGEDGLAKLYSLLCKTSKATWDEHKDTLLSLQKYSYFVDFWECAKLPEHTPLPYQYRFYIRFPEDLRVIFEFLQANPRVFVNDLFWECQIPETSADDVDRLFDLLETRHSLYEIQRMMNGARNSPGPDQRWIPRTKDFNSISHQTFAGRVGEYQFKKCYS